MPLRIDADKKRFNDIIRGKIRKELKKYITHDEMIGKQGDTIVKIPIPNIDPPKFKFNDKQGGGTGQGDGKPGDAIGDDGEEPGSGKKAGEGAGEHGIEVEMTMDELADLLAEELELPNIENKGKKSIKSRSHKYRTIHRTGPSGLKSFRRTFKEALKRVISSGTYKPGDMIIPHREDERYKAPRTIEKESTNAVIIYMMDVSGSMGEEQKRIVRTTSFWMNAWLKKQYKGLESRYIIHDSAAKEVSEAEFFTTKENGGTTISSAYKLCAELIRNSYPVSEWNIYPFHFSDGDNFSSSDTDECVKILKTELIPWSNMFGYGQTEAAHSSGSFLNDVKTALADEPKFTGVKMDDRDSIMGAIKSFLGKNR